MGKVSYDKIARNGGIYDTAKYRYIIDTTTDEIKRTPISNLDTTAMLGKDAWEVVGYGPHTLPFTNTDISPAQMGETRAQRELRQHIECAFSRDAITVSRKLRNLFDEQIDRIDPNYLASFIASLLNKARRYEYIEHMDSRGVYSAQYDIAIDLVTRTFYQVKREDVSRASTDEHADSTRYEVIER